MSERSPGGPFFTQLFPSLFLHLSLSPFCREDAWSLPQLREMKCQLLSSADSEFLHLLERVTTCLFTSQGYSCLLYVVMGTMALLVSVALFKVWNYPAVSGEWTADISAISTFSQGFHSTIWILHFPLAHTPSVVRHLKATSGTHYRSIMNLCFGFRRGQLSSCVLFLFLF